MKFAKQPRLGMTLSALSCVALIACSTPEKKPDPPPVTEPKVADVKPPPVVNDKPVELTLKMDAISAKEGNIELKPGGTLKSGDRMAISYSVDQPAYVYIAMAPAVGQAAILPPKGGADELVQPGKTLRFPSIADKWIKMDDTTGVENFFVYASKTPLPSADLINMVNADAAAAKKKAASRPATKPKSTPKHSDSAPVLTADSRGIEIEGEEPETQPTSVNGSGGIVRRQFSVNHK